MTFENQNLKSGFVVAYMVAYASIVFLENIFKKIVYLKDFREGSILENKIGKVVFLKIRFKKQYTR